LVPRPPLFALIFQARRSMALPSHLYPIRIPALCGHTEGMKQGCSRDGAGSQDDGMQSRIGRISKSRAKPRSGDRCDRVLAGETGRKPHAKVAKEDTQSAEGELTKLYEVGQIFVACVPSRENATKALFVEQKATKGTKTLRLQAAAAEPTSFPSLPSVKNAFPAFNSWWRTESMRFL